MIAMSMFGLSVIDISGGGAVAHPERLRMRPGGSISETAL